MLACLLLPALSEKGFYKIVWMSSTTWCVKLPCFSLDALLFLPSFAFFFDRGDCGMKAVSVLLVKRVKILFFLFFFALCGAALFIVLTHLAVELL